MISSLGLEPSPSKVVQRRPRRFAMVPSMHYLNFHELMTAYLETHLKGKASYRKQALVASQWLLRLTEAPTRQQLRERHTQKGHGDFQPGACQANTEFMLLRAAIRWGLYHERWEGHDPTVGVKKWKTKKRKRVTKHEEIRKLLAYFDCAQTETEIRDRALFGLMLFTGCRPGEARTAKVQSILPYGTMGCWNKGQTKNGEEYEVPVPSHYLPWLEAWRAIRPRDQPNPYLFSGQGYQRPLSADMIGRRWHDLRLIVGLTGLWNYDLRRSLATHLSNELNATDAKIDAILGHEKPTSLGHYLHVSFDAMTGPIEAYAEWLYSLQAHPLRMGNRQSCFNE